MTDASSLGTISDILREIAKEELGETEQIRQEGIDLIKQWIQSQENETFLQWGKHLNRIIVST